MKAEELQIVDWVLSKSINKPAKVIGISPMEGKGVDGYTFTLLAENNHVLFVRRCSVEPIPLTREILKKNGWKEPRENRWLYLSVGRDDLNILLYNNGMNIEYMNMFRNYEDNDEVNYGHSFEFPRVIYVHELQHILRLCGIEKEIVL